MRMSKILNIVKNKCLVLVTPETPPSSVSMANLIFRVVQHKISLDKLSFCL